MDSHTVYFTQLLIESYRQNCLLSMVVSDIQYVYSTKKLRKMCSSTYFNKSSKELEIQTLVCYKVYFYLSNEASFEVVASAVAEKNNVKVD